jgi:dihydrofolate reductase
MGKESVMRKIVVAEFVSLDGVMEGPGSQDPYEHAGWTMGYWDDGIGKLKFDELFGSDALLLGRVTYEGFASAWPSQSDEAGFADRMNALPKYVASGSEGELAWNNSHHIRGDVAGEVARLKQQDGLDILVNGSGELVRSLMQADLIDEYRLLVYPVVLGSGKRLFKEGSAATLRLVETKAFECGVVAMTYQAANR